MPHAVVSERQRGRAKQLRQAMTPAETLLWRDLKADQQRDAFFVSEGFQVLRFANEQVCADRGG
jgi:very-short-patch-repair endonuclease